MPRPRPYRSSRSGSTPYDRKHNLSHHRAHFALVIDRQRGRLARDALRIVYDAQDITPTERRSPDPAASITKPSRTDGDCLAAVPRSNRHSARHRPCLNFPRVPSLEAFGRRPRCSWLTSHMGPSSETLHITGRSPYTCGKIAVCRCDVPNRLGDHAVDCSGVLA
jgi:hypothetical protein